MTTFKPGDKVRLRDGMLPWIGKRDGWTVKDAHDGYGLIREGGPATVYVDREDVEPDSPPIPPEPDAPAVLLAWGAPLHTEITMARTWDGRWAMPSDSLTYSWKNVPQLDTATATPLYPVPDPDDDEAVWEVADRAGRSGRVSTVRAVLRALRGGA